jgi:hypothetical protein
MNPLIEKQDSCLDWNLQTRKTGEPTHIGNWIADWSPPGRGNLSSYFIMYLYLLEWQSLNAQLGKGISFLCFTYEPTISLDVPQGRGSEAKKDRSRRQRGLIRSLDRKIIPLKPSERSAIGWEVNQITISKGSRRSNYAYLLEAEGRGLPFIWNSP